jgi:hypothetical protein
LKKIGVGIGALAGLSVLPKKWTRPIVEQIVLPAHAQSSQLHCVCQISGLEVDASVNEFSASYTYSCMSTSSQSMRITGPGVVDTLGYTQSGPTPDGSRDLVDVGPYNATVFQFDETYTFTLSLTNAANNVIATCVATVVAISRAE